MRRAIALIPALILVPLPAAAWEFSPDPLCTLRHRTEAAALRITYDPGGPPYTLDLTLLSGDWAASGSFGMAFAGGLALTIGTDRHRITGPTLRVTDSGFGNVLNGMEFNETVSAFTETQAVELSLQGAAGPVAQFRACASAPPATS